MVSRESRTAAGRPSPDRAFPDDRSTDPGDRADEITVLAPDMGGRSYWDCMTLCCLQGLANRDAPRVMMFYPEKSHEAWESDHPVPDERVFYEWYRSYDHTTFVEFDDPWELFDRLDPLPVEGYAIVDERAPVTVNVAANYAGSDRSLPVTAEALDSRSLPELPVDYDLREPHEGIDFRNATRAEAYGWAFDNQWPDSNQRRLANLGTPDDASGATPNGFFTSNRSRDVTVAENGFFMDLSSRFLTGERRLKGSILGEAPRESIVFGWHTPRETEHEHVSHLSGHGLVSIGAATHAANVSFHSRFEPPGDPVGRFREHANRDPSRTPPEDRIYLTFVLSDGDSLNFLTRRAMGGQWLLEERGDLPFAWEVAPKLAELGPGILDYLQATATDEDSFVGGPSGVAYFYPGAAGESTLRDLLRSTRSAFADLGLSVTAVMNPGSNRTRGIYEEELGGTLDGVVEGYVNGVTDPVVYGSGFTWVPTALPLSRDRGESVEDLQDPLERVARERSDRPLFVPVHLPAHSLTVADAAALVDRLPDEFVAVGPAEFFDGVRRAGEDAVVTGRSQLRLRDRVTRLGRTLLARAGRRRCGWR